MEKPFTQMHATVSKISFRLQLFIFIKNVLCVNECQGFEKFLISNYRSKYDIDQVEEILLDIEKFGSIEITSITLE